MNERLDTDMAIDYRAEFDIPRDVCYLNAAYMTPQPRRVVEAAIRGATRRSQPWKIAPPDFFENVEALRDAHAKIIGCSAENVAIVPSASYGIASAAANIRLRRGDVVLGMSDQFPANYYSWRRQALAVDAEIEIVSKEDGQSWTEALLIAIERLGDDIAIATLEGHHWASGDAVDLETVIGALRAVDARVVLDLSQTAGAFPVSMSELSPDFMATAGYKWLFCPYGVAFLYVDETYFDGTPIEEGWMNRNGAEDFSRLSEFTDQYQSGARRFDVSEKSSYSNVAGALAAMQLLGEWNVATISESLATTNERIAHMLEGYGFETTDAATRGPHFQGARLPDTDPRHLAAQLVQSGVYASVRGDRLRVAPHLYTDEEDLAHFETALKSALG